MNIENKKKDLKCVRGKKDSKDKTDIGESI
jgi:hypothetical protein